MSKLEREIKELKFQLKALSNFVYEHHHDIDVLDNLGHLDHKETSKGRVWVDYEDGSKEEPGGQGMVEVKKKVAEK